MTNEDELEIVLPTDEISFTIYSQNKVGSIDFEQRRGHVLYKAIKLELLIDSLLVKFLKPERMDFFQNVVLNGSILDLGKKIKILNAAELITKKEGEIFIKVNQHRNAFAHAPVYYVQGIIFDTERADAEQPDTKHEISIMNSKGLVEKKDATAVYTEFLEKCDEATRIIELKLNSM